MKFRCPDPNLLKWHDHFALLPVHMGGEECRWLETVERRFDWRGQSGAYYGASYRPKSEKAGQ